ncbi:MAG: metallophosphoesterase [Paracoccaceae bacterium]
MYRFIGKQLQRIGLWYGSSDAAFVPLRPDAPFWAIGDVHGCSTLLDQLLAQMNDDPVIFVGDLIDRGPNSREVLERVFELCSGPASKYQTLMGNHEKLLLDFLKDPGGAGRSWTRYGGLQTLESFGVPLSGSVLSDAAYCDARDALVKKMGQPLIHWLAELPYAWSSGNVHVVHAGADPSRPISTQEPHHLIWGHPDFGHIKRTDGQWVLHGHVIVPNPTQMAGRIAIDTGAYATGTLTAAHVSEGSVDFVSTGALLNKRG